MPVYLVATLDTKGQELALVRDRMHDAGVKTCVIDAGCLGTPQFAADVPREAVFAAAGTTLTEVQQRQDRGHAVTVAAAGVAKLVVEHHAAGIVQGVLALGGSAGTTIGTTAMRALPLGVPKVMVSTLAAGQTRPFVGGKDIFLLNSVVDIAGLNRISRAVLWNAAGAMIGMVQQPAIPTPQTDKPLIAATMFGVTTPCVEHSRKLLEAAGYEVLVFHATGTGGEAMESLIADGLIAGVLDITTTELADEFVGGVLSAGPTRLTAAGKRGVPQVISVGALDMVNFGPRPTVPEKFHDRLFYQHNANITLMRTTPGENRQLGEEIGRKAAEASGPTTILFPLRGVSAIDVSGKPFDDPAARTALLEGIRAKHGNVELLELDAHINDAVFAETCVKKLLERLSEAHYSTR